MNSPFPDQRGRQLLCGRRRQFVLITQVAPWVCTEQRHTAGLTRVGLLQLPWPERATELVLVLMDERRARSRREL